MQLKLRGRSNQRHRKEREMHRDAAVAGEVHALCKGPMYPKSSFYSPNTSLQQPNICLLRTQHALVTAVTEVKRTQFLPSRGSAFRGNRSPTWFGTGLPLGGTGDTTVSGKQTCRYVLRSHKGPPSDIVISGPGAPF